MYRAGVVPLLAFAVLMLHSPARESRRDAPAPANLLAAPPASAPVPAAAAPSVRIQHELVRLPKLSKPPQRANRPFRSTRLALAHTPDGRTPLIVRASRAFVGDGRFKPEPFPRLSR